MSIVFSFPFQHPGPNGVGGGKDKDAAAAGLRRPPASFCRGDLIRVQHEGGKPGSDIGIVQSVDWPSSSLEVRYILGGVGRHVPFDLCESWDQQQQQQQQQHKAASSTSSSSSSSSPTPAATAATTAPPGEVAVATAAGADREPPKEESLKDFALAFTKALHLKTPCNNTRCVPL